ncbi:hypothetical protein [Erwinia amylovora]
MCIRDRGINCNSSACELVIKSLPVSYTHLDVYKRQGYKLQLIGL